MKLARYLLLTEPLRDRLCAFGQPAVCQDILPCSTQIAAHKDITLVDARLLRCRVISDVSKYRVTFIFKVHQSTRKHWTQKWRNTGCSGKSYLDRCRPATRRRCGRNRLCRSGPDRGSVSAGVTGNRQGGGGVQNVNAFYIKLDWIPLKIKALWSFEVSTNTHPSKHHIA